jgi:hypothetical protein
VRHWLLAATLAVTLVGSGPVAAAPVIYPDPSLPGDVTLDELSSFGSHMTASGDLLVVHGGVGQSEITATVLFGAPLQIVDTIRAQNGIAIGDERLAAMSINANGFPEVSLYEIAEHAVTLLASLEIPGGQDFDRFGAEMAVSRSLIAVVDAGASENSDVVLMIEVAEKDGAPNLNGTARIETGLTHTQVSLSGDRLLVSGVPALGNVGHLVMYDAITGLELDRIENVGGGSVLVADESVFVQRNQFFTEPSGPWTAVELNSKRFGASHEVPGVGSSLAASGDTVVLGDSERGQVLVFERSDDDLWPFRFTQAVGNSDLKASDLFGASVALSRGHVAVGVPGLAVDGIGNRGSLVYFGVADGPVGCTVVGTPGDDEKLIGTQGDDTICGLGGNDRLLGFSGDDVLHGGAGDDALLGNSGADVLFGGEGDDILNGGDDDDALFGSDGDDTGNGGAGDDTFDGGAGRDKGNGGDGVNFCDAEQRFRC